MRGNTTYANDAFSLPGESGSSQATFTTVTILNQQAYTKRYSDYFRVDLKLSYNINKPKVTHQISIDIQNITNNQNLFKEAYNLQSDKFTQEYQIGFFPEIQYRIMF